MHSHRGEGVKMNEGRDKWHLKISENMAHRAKGSMGKKKEENQGLLCSTVLS